MMTILLNISLMRTSNDVVVVVDNSKYFITKKQRALRLMLLLPKNKIKLAKDPLMMRHQKRIDLPSF